MSVPIPTAGQTESHKPEPPSTAQLRIIQLALFAGPPLLAVFGLLSPGHEPVASMPLMTWLAYGMCAAALAALLWLRGVRVAQDARGRITLSIVGWAVAEGTALFGAVLIVLGGAVVPFLCGLVVMLAAWAWFPADPERAE